MTSMTSQTARVRPGNGLLENSLIVGRLDSCGFCSAAILPNIEKQKTIIHGTPIAR